MLEAKSLDENLWDEAMNVAVHIQNKVSQSSMKGKTPFEAYFGHRVGVSILGCLGPLHGTEFRMIRGNICNLKVLNVYLLDI